MPSPFSVSFAAIVTLIGTTTANDPFSLCKNNKCGDCPVSVTNVGTGFPNCVVYNSEDVFANQNFSGSVGGGYRVYLDVNKPEYKCQIIVRSPAHTEEVGCGKIVASFGEPVCAVLNIEESFMVQYCCGEGDCHAAGASRFMSAKFRRDAAQMEEIASSGGLVGLQIRDQNGRIIEPARVGPPPPIRDSRSMPSIGIGGGSSCEKNSWVPDPGRESYTRPADGAQIVKAGVSGPADVTITQQRSQGWTTTLGADFGFADILTLGVHFETSFTETITKGSQVTFHVPDGQSGDVVFTPTLLCSTGHGTCNEKTVSGEVCTPYESGDDLAGVYTVVIHS